MSKTDHLIKHEPLIPAVMFQAGGLRPILDAIKKETDSFVPDVTTQIGRREVSSWSNKVRRSKVFLDNIGKDHTATRKRETKICDVERKFGRDFLDALAIKVRYPLTLWEDAEKARVAKIKQKMEVFNVSAFDDDNRHLSAEELMSRLQEIWDEPIDASFGQFSDEAAILKNNAIEKLEGWVNVQVKVEADKEELEERRKEKAERDKKDAYRAMEDKARRDANAKVAREKCALIEKANKAIRDKEFAEEAARRAVEAAERRAEEAAERKKRNQEAVVRAKEAAEKRRSLDIDNRNKINAEIKASLAEIFAISLERACLIKENLLDRVCFIKAEDIASEVVAAIYSGSIPHVYIKHATDAELKEAAKKAAEKKEDEDLLQLEHNNTFDDLLRSKKQDI